MQIKAQWDTITHLVEWLLKKMTILNAGENAEQL